MEDPEAEARTLARTYRQLPKVNRLVSRWDAVYRRYVRPELRAGGRRVLDIGFGAGDLPMALDRWSGADGVEAEVTAIDTDRRALDYVRSRYPNGPVTFRHGTSRELVEEGARFDAVVSNHVLHHLGSSELQELLRNIEAYEPKVAALVDIERGPFAYGLFWALATLFFRGSFIRHDGLVSIRRSYTFSELEEVAPPGWTVERLRPFRLVLVRYQAMP